MVNYKHTEGRGAGTTQQRDRLKPQLFYKNRMDVGVNWIHYTEQVVAMVHTCNSMTSYEMLLTTGARYLTLVTKLSESLQGGHTTKRKALETRKNYCTTLS